MLALLQRVLLLLLALATRAASNEDILEVVSALAPAFNLNSVQIVCQTSRLGRFDRVKRWIASAKMTTKVTSHVDINGQGLKEQNVVYCVDDENFEAFLEAHAEYSHSGQHHTWFALGNKSSIDRLIRRSNIAIDQAVYFVTTDTDFVIESYTIGEAKVRTTLGYLFRHQKTGVLYYKPGQGVEESFMERRSNFKGHSLTALTAGQLPFLAIPGYRQAYADKEGWEKRPDGIEVKDMSGMPMGGIFYDVLKILENNANFTSKMQMAKSDSVTFGEPVNGTWNGLIGRTMRGEFDFLNGPVTQSDIRFEVVDFSLPMGTETIAFYIPTQALERREWLSFLYPLRAEVWTCLLFNSLLLLMALKLFELFYSGKSFKQRNVFVLMADAAGDLWMLGASYFGRKPVRQSTSKERAIRVLLVFAFLSGNIVFMSYRASLTAELSVRREAMPFSNVEELMESDYK